MFELHKFYNYVERKNILKTISNKQEKKQKLASVILAFLILEQILSHVNILSEKHKLVRLRIQFFCLI